MERPDPEDYQPPLRWWGQLWRILLCLAVSAVVTPEMWIYQWDGHRGWVWASIVIGVVAYVLLLWRRRFPLPVALATNVLSVVSAPAVGPAVLAVVSVATRRQWRELVVVGVTSVASGMLYYRIQPTDQHDPLWFDLAFNVTISVGLVGWGMFIGSRRELVRTLRQRAETAEAERDLRVREARGAERSRIAREMHDVLAHRISHISMRAGALEYRTDLPAEELRAGVSVIHEQANAALEELRQVLGMLRDPEGVPMHAPQPTYADVAALVDDVRRDGLEVDYDDRIDPAHGPLPDPAGRAVFRIVQEGITNARKHAPAAHLTITLDGSPEEGVRVELVNPLGFGDARTPGAGLGLIGLAERAALVGGWLEHRRHAGRFELVGWIPWAP